VPGTDHQPPVRPSVDAALDPGAAGLRGGRHLALLTAPPRAAEVDLPLTSSDQGEDRTSRRQAEVRRMQRESSGARRIRTADLLGAIQARGQHGPVFQTCDLQVKTELCCSPDQTIFRRIYVDIHVDMRGLGHESPLVPNLTMGRFESASEDCCRHNALLASLSAERSGDRTRSTRSVAPPSSARSRTAKARAAGAGLDLGRRVLAADSGATHARQNIK
jgi:hypothetical protein